MFDAATKIYPQILCKFQFQVILGNQFRIQNIIDPSEHIHHYWEHGFGIPILRTTKLSLTLKATLV